MESISKLNKILFPFHFYQTCLVLNFVYEYQKSKTRNYV